MFLKVQIFQRLKVSSVFTCWMTGSPTIRKKVFVPKSLPSCPVASSHWLILAVPLLFIPADPLPCCWAFGRGWHRIGPLMSPIPRDGIKQSGDVTPEQEGGRRKGREHIRDLQAEKVNVWTSACMVHILKYTRCELYEHTWWAGFIVFAHNKPSAKRKEVKSSPLILL